MDLEACFWLLSPESSQTEPVRCLSSFLEHEDREGEARTGEAAWHVRSELCSGEIAEEMEKERRTFQLNMCEVRTGTGQVGAAGAWHIPHRSVWLLPTLVLCGLPTWSLSWRAAWVEVGSSQPWIGADQGV